MALVPDWRRAELAGIAALKSVCLKWCDDPQLAALVGIRREEAGDLATLWERNPTDPELAYLRSLIGEVGLAPSEVSGAFSIGAIARSSGSPPESGVQEDISAGRLILGYVCSTGIWNSGGSLAGLFLDTSSGDRWGITAAHVLWGTDVVGWPEAGHKFNLGSVRVLTPWSPPTSGDTLMADAAAIAITENGLGGQTTQWVMGGKKLRQCGAGSNGCVYSNKNPKTYCIKASYGNVCVTLTDHLVIEDSGFATLGNSGALVEKRDGTEVGMTVAISRQGTHAAVTPWSKVLAGLGLQNRSLKRLT